LQLLPNACRGACIVVCMRLHSLASACNHYNPNPNPNTCNWFIIPISVGIGPLILLLLISLFQ
jgi:hypothetical protein